MLGELDHFWPWISDLFVFLLEMTRFRWHSNLHLTPEQLDVIRLDQVVLPKFECSLFVVQPGPTRGFSLVKGSLSWCLACLEVRF